MSEIYDRLAFNGYRVEIDVVTLDREAQTHCYGFATVDQLSVVRAWAGRFPSAKDAARWFSRYLDNYELSATQLQFRVMDNRGEVIIPTTDTWET